MCNESKQVFQKADYTDESFDDLVICTDEDMLVKTIYYSVWKHQNVVHCLIRLAFTGMGIIYSLSSIRKSTCCSFIVSMLCILC